MTSISKFDANVYSEEVFTTDADELAEVNRLMAQDDWQGYSEWASGLEETEKAAALSQFAFERQLERQATVKTASGPMLIKRECAHKGCGYCCAYDVRINGIAV